MLLQTNSYIVPKDKRSEHARLLRKFRQTLARLGCDDFEVYEQVGANWSSGESTGRFVQLMRFRDRKHQVDVQSAERTDPVAQQLIQEFCALINFPYQQQQGLFALGYYSSALPVGPSQSRGSVPPRTPAAAARPATPPGIGAASAAAATVSDGPIELPPSNQDTAGGEGASMMDFGALTGDAGAQPPPLRLADEAPADAGLVESTLPSEDSPNGEHADPDDELVHLEREEVLGELVDDTDARRQKTEG